MRVRQAVVARSRSRRRRSPAPSAGTSRPRSRSGRRWSSRCAVLRFPKASGWSRLPRQRQRKWPPSSPRYPPSRSAHRAVGGGDAAHPARQACSQQQPAAENHHEQPPPDQVAPPHHDPTQRLYPLVHLPPSNNGRSDTDRLSNQGPSDAHARQSISSSASNIG